MAPPGSQHGLSWASIGVVLVVSRRWPWEPSQPTGTAAGFWVLDTFTGSMEEIKITLGAMRAHRQIPLRIIAEGELSMCWISFEKELFLRWMGRGPAAGGSTPGM